MDVSFTSLAIVAAVAFAAPLALGLVPAVRLPAVVLEIVLGILVGPAVFGWVRVDDAVEVMPLRLLSVLLFPVGALVLLRYAAGTPSPRRSASQAA